LRRTSSSSPPLTRSPMENMTMTTNRFSKSTGRISKLSSAKLRSRSTPMNHRKVIPANDRSFGADEGSAFPFRRLVHARANHFAFSMTASTFPSRMARLSAAWSFSFWSAYAIEKAAIALSKESLLPRYPLIIAASPERAWESARE
jgi:hypothetical protein